MMISRREFLILTATFAAGCALTDQAAAGAAGKEHTFDAGLVGDYSKDGVYAAFRDQGFFIIRQSGKLLVLSAICTHRKCKLKEKADQSFYCPCHGSTFTPEGHVTRGPARRDLPAFATSVDDNGHLLVTLPG